MDNNTIPTDKFELIEAYDSINITFRNTKEPILDLNNTNLEKEIINTARTNKWYGATKNTMNIIYNHNNNITENNEISNSLAKTIGNLNIYIIAEDLEKFVEKYNVDVIVNAANDNVSLNGRGICGVIHSLYNSTIRNHTHNTETTTSLYSNILNLMEKKSTTHKDVNHCKNNEFNETAVYYKNGECVLIEHTPCKELGNASALLLSVGPNASRGNTEFGDYTSFEKCLFNTYLNSLYLVAYAKKTSVIFPCISGSIFRGETSYSEISQIVYNALCRFTEICPNYCCNIILNCYDPDPETDLNNTKLIKTYINKFEECIPLIYIIERRARRPEQEHEQEHEHEHEQEHEQEQKPPEEQEQEQEQKSNILVHGIYSKKGEKNNDIVKVNYFTIKDGKTIHYLYVTITTMKKTKTIKNRNTGETKSMEYNEDTIDFKFSDIDEKTSTQINGLCLTASVRNWNKNTCTGLLANNICRLSKKNKISFNIVNENNKFKVTPQLYDYDTKLLITGNPFSSNYSSTIEKLREQLKPNQKQIQPNQKQLKPNQKQIQPNGIVVYGKYIRDSEKHTNESSIKVDCFKIINTSKYLSIKILENKLYITFPNNKEQSSLNDVNYLKAKVVNWNGETGLLSRNRFVCRLSKNKKIGIAILNQNNEFKINPVLFDKEGKVKFIGQDMTYKKKVTLDITDLCNKLKQYSSSSTPPKKTIEPISIDTTDPNEVIPCIENPKEGTNKILYFKTKTIDEKDLYINIIFVKTNDEVHLFYIPNNMSILNDTYLQHILTENDIYLNDTYLTVELSNENKIIDKHYKIKSDETILSETQKKILNNMALSFNYDKDNDKLELIANLTDDITSKYEFNMKQVEPLTMSDIYDKLKSSTESSTESSTDSDNNSDKLPPRRKNKSNTNQNETSSGTFERDETFRRRRRYEDGTFGRHERNRRNGTFGRHERNRRNGTFERNRTNDETFRRRRRDRRNGIFRRNERYEDRTNDGTFRRRERDRTTTKPNTETPSKPNTETSSSLQPFTQITPSSNPNPNIPQSYQRPIYRTTRPPISEPSKTQITPSSNPNPNIPQSYQRPIYKTTRP